MPTTQSVANEVAVRRPLLRRPLLRRRWLTLLWLLAALGWATPLQGLTGVHNPSTIIKSGNTYWVFATGQGTYSMSSTDLVKWPPGPRAVFVNNAYPSWISTKVPGFAGNFWAPECVFQNGKYYLYYSCSTFGSKVSAIGLATNATLDPTSPNYRWVDEGEVILTNSSSPVNAIDLAIFRDASNNLWLTYGSYFGSIRITQLNAATGKPLGATQTAVANGGVEASYVKQHGSWYYLDRASDGILTFASLNGNRVVEVPFASASPGVQLALFDYNGCTCQHSNLVSTALAPARRLTGVSIFPVPAGRGGFTVDLGAQLTAEATTVTVYKLQGQLVHGQAYAARLA